MRGTYAMEKLYLLKTTLRACYHSLRSLYRCANITIANSQLKTNIALIPVPRHPNFNDPSLVSFNFQTKYIQMLLLLIVLFFQRSKLQTCQTIDGNAHSGNCPTVTKGQ